MKPAPHLRMLRSSLSVSQSVLAAAFLTTAFLTATLAAAPAAAIIVATTIRAGHGDAAIKIDDGYVNIDDNDVYSYKDAVRLQEADHLDIGSRGSSSAASRYTHW